MKIINKSIIFLICFLMIMITPASANQIQMSKTTQEITEPKISGNKLTPSLKILYPKKQNYNKIGSKLKTSKKVNTQNAKYTNIIANACKLLPIMEKSYKKTNDEITASNKALKTLKSEEINTTQQIKETSSQLENYELTTNNTQDYKDLKNKHNHYTNLNKNITTTEKTIKKIKSILEKKQTHTKNCVKALKQIKKSKNIPNAVTTYNKNMKSLGVIRNNMATEVQQQKEIILNSNKANNDNNDINNSKVSITDPTTKALRYISKTSRILTGATFIGYLISFIIEGNTAANAEIALNTAAAVTEAIEAATTDATITITEVLTIDAYNQMAVAAISVAETASVVSSILFAATVVLLVVAIALTITYIVHNHKQNHISSL